MVHILTNRASTVGALLNSLLNQVKKPLNHRRVIRTHAPLGIGGGARNSFPTVISHSRHIATTGGNPGPLPPSSDQIILSKRDGFLSVAKTQEFLSQLTEQQKLVLFNTLNLEVLRQKYEDDLGHYLTKFGRPTSMHQDPTGTFTPVSPEWLKKKLAAEIAAAEQQPIVPQPIITEEKPSPATLKDIWAVGLKNAVPFVGFGFLDNLIMILAGDYIDTRIGAAFAISTMAAAALGNTISDVAGLASAWYVERVAEKIGIHHPELTAFQLASWQIRWVTNIGRAIGVTIGCLLGMIPLLFLNTSKGDDADEESKSSQKNKTAK